MGNRSGTGENPLLSQRNIGPMNREMMVTLWYFNIAIENGHRNSGFSHKKMVIFHSYVSLPEGKTGVKPHWLGKMNNCIQGGAP